MAIPDAPKRSSPIGCTCLHPALSCRRPHLLVARRTRNALHESAPADILTSSSRSGSLKRAYKLSYFGAIDAPASQRASETTGAMPKVICVDLDGTLVRSDLLQESFLQALRHAPATVLSALICLKDGMAAVKRRPTEKVGALISVENLPFDAAVVEYLEAERSKGSYIELVSGADQFLVDRVVRHLGLFDAGFGSDGCCTRKLLEETRCIGISSWRPRTRIYRRRAISPPTDSGSTLHATLFL
jgi:hypothetical protein